MANFLNTQYIASNIFLIFVVGAAVIILLILLKATVLLLVNIDFKTKFRTLIFKTKENMNKKEIDTNLTDEEKNDAEIASYYNHNSEEQQNIAKENSDIVVIETQEPIKLDFPACLIISLFSFAVLSFVLLMCLGVGKIISARII